jgi:hypothetical protein
MQPNSSVLILGRATGRSPFSLMDIKDRMVALKPGDFYVTRCPAYSTSIANSVAMRTSLVKRPS